MHNLKVSTQICKQPKKCAHCVPPPPSSPPPKCAIKVHARDAEHTLSTFTLALDYECAQ